MAIDFRLNFTQDNFNGNVVVRVNLRQTQNESWREGGKREGKLRGRRVVGTEKPRGAPFQNKRNPIEAKAEISRGRRGNNKNFQLSCLLRTVWCEGERRTVTNMLGTQVHTKYTRRKYGDRPGVCSFSLSILVPNVHYFLIF